MILFQFIRTFAGNPNGFGGPLGVPDGGGNPMHGGPSANPRPQPAGAGFNLVLPGPSAVTATGAMDLSEGGQRRFSHAGNTVMMNPSSKLASGKCLFLVLFALERVYHDVRGHARMTSVCRIEGSWLFFLILFLRHFICHSHARANLRQKLFSLHFQAVL